MNFAIGGATGFGCYAASNGYNNRPITQLFGKGCIFNRRRRTSWRCRGCFNLRIWWWGCWQCCLAPEHLGFQFRILAVPQLSRLVI
jgi:hypothetical protein